MTLAFLPDAPTNTPEALMQVEAVPTLRGYRGPASGITAGFPALAATPQGAALVLRLDGQYRLFAGTQTALYEGVGTSYSDVSSAPYTAGAARWRFTQFGNTSFAVNQVTQLQYSNSGAFAAVANAPKAALIETFAGFVVLANCDDTGTGLGTGFGPQPHRWWCSQIFNPTGSWAPSVPTQATTGLLVDAPGPIVGLKRLGDLLIAYKNKSMFVGQYVAGDAAVIKWAPVPGEVGVASNEAVVSIGTAHFFIGYEDIYVFDGTRPVSIGAGVKEWFFARLNKSFADRIEGLHDFNNQCVYWFYPSSGSTALNSVLVYNYQAKRWGHITLSTTTVVPTVIPGVTYDTLGNLFATYDALPDIPYDSPFWQSSAPVLAYYDTARVLQTLTGAAGASSLTTGDIGDDERVTLCSRVRPRYRTIPATAQITPMTRMQLGGPLTVNPASPINGDRYDVLQSARWHSFKLDHTGEVEVEAIVPKMVPEGSE